MEQSKLSSVYIYLFFSFVFFGHNFKMKELEITIPLQILKPYTDGTLERPLINVRNTFQVI